MVLVCDCRSPITKTKSFKLETHQLFMEDFINYKGLGGLWGSNNPPLISQEVSDVPTKRRRDYEHGPPNDLPFRGVSVSSYHLGVCSELQMCLMCLMDFRLIICERQTIYKWWMFHATRVLFPEGNARFCHGVPSKLHSE